MNPMLEHAAFLTRRQFLGRASLSPGVLALASLLNDKLFAAAESTSPHFKPRAKRVIYLFQSGAPSQMSCQRCRSSLITLITTTAAGSGSTKR